MYYWIYWQNLCWCIVYFELIENFVEKLFVILLPKKNLQKNIFTKEKSSYLIVIT